MYFLRKTQPIYVVRHQTNLDISSIVFTCACEAIVKL
jgi:hypothetical protein